jgi:hypothetical protein
VIALLALTVGGALIITALVIDGARTATSPGRAPTSRVSDVKQRRGGGARTAEGVTGCWCGSPRTPAASHLHHYRHAEWCPARHTWRSHHSE